MRDSWAGLPKDIIEEDLKDWLCMYGEIKGNMVFAQVKEATNLKNMNGIKDFTEVKVKMELHRDFREREYYEGLQTRISYKNMPKTCFGRPRTMPDPQTCRNQELSASLPL